MGFKKSDCLVSMRSKYFIKPPLFFNILIGELFPTQMVAIHRSRTTVNAQSWRGLRNVALTVSNLLYRSTSREKNLQQKKNQKAHEFLNALHYKTFPSLGGKCDLFATFLKHWIPWTLKLFLQEKNWRIFVKDAKFASNMLYKETKKLGEKRFFATFPPKLAFLLTP